MKFKTILVTVFMSATQALAADAPPAENLEKLVSDAVANNPEIRGAEAREQMYRSRAKQAGSWDDPMLMLKIQNGIISDPLNFRKDTMTQKVIGISQQIPYLGKRGVKTEIAEREADTYKWQIEEKKLEIARMVKEAYYQISFIDRASDIIDRNIAILDDFIKLAETRYTVGQGTQQDILKAQVERSKMLEMKINLVQQRRTQESNLNALLHRDPSTQVGKIPEYEIGAFSRTPEELRASAEENRPMIKAINAAMEKARASERLAGRDYYPDFNVSFEYMQRDGVDGQMGEDMYSLGVTFNLPFQRAKRAAAVAEAKAEASMAEAELAGLKNTINQTIGDLRAQLERREKLVELYKNGLIPQARQTLESAVIAYRVGKVDFLSLLDARVALYNYEREYFDSLADYQMKKAQLEALIGKSLQ
jgi:outer membrane protein, heavy metal efflux system